MSAVTQSPAQAAPVRLVRLFIIVGLVIAGLAVLDVSLRKAEVREVHNSAQSAYDAGQAYLKSGSVRDAVEAFRRAHSLERTNTTYQLGLTGALMTAQNTAEAGPLIQDLLQVSPNNGEANLLAARLMNKEGKRVETAAYYHRAIYGEWPSDPVQQRIAARRELIEFYRAGGQQQEMLSELIPLQEDAGKDRSLQIEVARLYLQAGSPGHAAAVYTELIKENPRDASAYAGRGEAELESGDYRHAHTDFTAAAARNPQNKEIEAKLQLVQDLTNLDPTVRRLTSSEKYRRSEQLLQMARKSLESCLARPGMATTAEIATLFSEAERLAPAKPPANVSNELSEEVLDVAQSLWNTRVKACGLPPPSDPEQTLRLIAARLGQ